MNGVDVTKLVNIVPGIQLPPGKASLPNIHIPKAHSKRRRRAMSAFHDMIEKCVPSSLEGILDLSARRNGKSPHKKGKTKKRSKSK